MAGSACAQTVGGIDQLAASHAFLTSERERGGVLYRATAGELGGLLLPLGFRDSPEYWALHVCEFPSTQCAVTDRYDAGGYTLAPGPGAAGELQTERVNVHSGTSIYDAATWQIAVVLGEVANGFENSLGLPAWQLAANQNLQHSLGHGGDAAVPINGANRAVTRGDLFRYNGAAIPQPARAFVYRMIARSWLADDPFIDTPFAALIEVRELPHGNDAYRKGRISWADWKPFTGENAWALWIGPLQAARLHFVRARKLGHVPYADLAVRNALAVLPTFARMQSAPGAIYYAPAGTLQNQGEQQLVDPFEVSVENNASVLAGLHILRATLLAELRHDSSLGQADVADIQRALATIGTMIDGGRHADGSTTAGLLAFFRHAAWQQGEFVRGGRAGAAGRDSWQAYVDTRAVDANTWAVLALGAERVEQWFGFGAGFELWQGIKRWGAYGNGHALWGVGFSDRDGNGIDAEGRFRSGVMSAEWTAGAITMLRELRRHYGTLAASAEHGAQVREFIAQLQADESAMLSGVRQLRLDNYAGAGFPGRPQDFHALVPLLARPYLYASRRHFVPFGWYANPLPSTCSTAWMIMVANGFDPFRAEIP